MSSQVAEVMVPPVVDAPRGAQWAAAVAVWIGRAIGGRRAPGTPAGAGRAKSAAPNAAERLAAGGAA